MKATSQLQVQNERVIVTQWCFAPGADTGHHVHARDYVVVEHPLQPFDPRNFSPGRLGLAQPWSYDAANLEGARALVGERQPRGPFLLQRLPPLPSATMTRATRWVHKITCLRLER